MFLEQYVSEHPIYTEPRLGQQYQQIREMRGPAHEAGLRIVDQLLLSRKPSQIIIESTPLYAVPSEELPDQALNNPSALAAVSMTEDIMDLARQHGIFAQHWVLLDDVNNGGEQFSKSEVWNGFVNGVCSELPIYSQVSRRQFESDYRASEEDTCAIMDAGFQMAKVLEATRDFTQIDSLPLFINVHPAGFKNQQRTMVERLRNLLKTDRNAYVMQISKATKNNFIPETYVHVWTNGLQSVEVTRPQLVNGSIIHSPTTQ